MRLTADYKESIYIFDSRSPFVHNPHAFGLDYGILLKNNHLNFILGSIKNKI